MGLIDGWIKGRIARKARRKLGSWGPLCAGALMLGGFILHALGEVAASDALLQAHSWLGVDSPVSQEALVGVRDALRALMPELHAWLGPIVGAGAAYKIGQKRKDARGELSKPPVLSTYDSLAVEVADPRAARFLRMWRHLMNDGEGMPSNAALREARRRVYGA